MQISNTDDINQTILYSRKKRFSTMPVFSTVYALRTISTDVLFSDISKIMSTGGRFCETD